MAKQRTVYPETHRSAGLMSEVKVREPTAKSAATATLTWKAMHWKVPGFSTSRSTNVWFWVDTCKVIARWTASVRELK